MQTPYLDDFGAGSTSDESSSSDPRCRPGSAIGGHYKVVSAIRGGIGQVYHCYDLTSGQHIALKTFQWRYANDPQIYNTLRSEVANWVALGISPYIVTCYGMEICENIPYIVLEWVPGLPGNAPDLRTRLLAGPLDPRSALQFAIDISLGLQHAQKIIPGFIHRDLKPENILITTAGVAKITDFGVATLSRHTEIDSIKPIDALGWEELRRKTKDLVARGVPGVTDMDKSGIAIGPLRLIGLDTRPGTPGYTSPEQRGQKAVDVRSDFYALGRLIYEMLTGHLAPASDDPGVYVKHLTIKCSENIANATAPIIYKCQREAKGDRFSSTEELVHDLSECYIGLFNSTPRIITSDPAPTAADYSARSRAYVYLNMPDRALDECLAAIRLDGLNDYYHTLCGCIYHRLGRFDQALQEFSRSLELDSRNPFAYVNRGVTWAAIGKNDAAIDDYSEAIGLKPDCAVAYINRAINRMAQGLPEDALHDLNTAIALDPKNAEAFLTRGVQYGAAGLYEEAIRDFDIAIQFNPGLAEAFANRGAALCHQGNLQSGLADFYHAIDLDDKCVRAYYNVAFTHLKQSKIREAAPYFEKAAELGHPEASASAAVCFAELAEESRANGKHDEAVRFYGKAIKWCPEDPGYLFNRGAVYEDQGSLKEALADFNEGLKVDQLNARAYRHRGEIEAALGMRERALNDLSQAIALQPQIADFRIARGVFFTNVRQWDAAMADFAKATEIEPFSATAHMNIGTVLANRGESGDALESFERAANLGSCTGAIYARRLRATLGRADLTFPHYVAERAFNALIEAEDPSAMEYAIRDWPCILTRDFDPSSMLPGQEPMVIEAVKQRMAFVSEMKAKQMDKRE